VSVSEFRYTICPVGNASYLAANRDEFIPAAFRRRNVKPVLLQTLPKETWAVHYTYRDPALFREGGNIPPIWAHAGNGGVVLLGITFLSTRRFVLARVNSDIGGPEDLRGKRLAIPVHPHAHIDFYKYGALRGFETALSLRGVSPREVRFVELLDDPDAWTVDLTALDEDRADAVFVRFVKAQRMLATGKYRIVCELTADPDFVWPINNEYPNILTVSRALTEMAPELVVEYVKQVIKAARWAALHMAEVVELFAKQLRGTPGEVIASLPPDFHRQLEPNFSKKGLWALESQKRFLFDKGAITKDFDIDVWKDETFLAQALRELEEEEKVG
jgi:2'-hydroxybiphenyl-2-sulfinate desulfinase